MEIAKDCNLQVLPFCRWIQVVICKIHKLRHKMCTKKDICRKDYCCGHFSCPMRFGWDGEPNCQKRKGNYKSVNSKERGHLFISKDVMKKMSADKIRDLLDNIY